MTESFSAALSCRPTSGSPSSSGAILHDTASGSERIADAHVVAACTSVDAAIVLTADPGDIAALAAAVPGTRIVTRHPGSPI